MKPVNKHVVKAGLVDRVKITIFSNGEVILEMPHGMNGIAAKEWKALHKSEIKRFVNDVPATVKAVMKSFENRKPTEVKNKELSDFAPYLFKTRGY
jgi:hypothetical protein